jgi:hypothetical protein
MFIVSIFIYHFYLYAIIMKISVKILTKNPIELEISENDTIADLIQKITAENDINSETIKIFFKGKQLNSQDNLNNKISDNSISEGSKLLVVCNNPLNDLDRESETDTDNENEISDELKEFITDHPDLIRIIIQSHPQYNDIVEKDSEFLDHFMDHITKICDGSETDLLDSINSDDDPGYSEEMTHAYYQLEKDLDSLQSELKELAAYIGESPSDSDESDESEGSI